MISDELGSNVPEVKAYCHAFLTIRDQLTDNQLRLLQIHYAAPEHTVKPIELAERVGYPNYSAVNLQYGLLAKRVCNVLDLQLRFHIQALIIYVHPGTNQDESPKWIMRPQVVQALQELGWDFESVSGPPEDISGKDRSGNELEKLVPDPIYEQIAKKGDFASPDAILAGFSYETDDRKPPDNRRRGQFRAGWEDATIREKVYTEKILIRLTWRNLGYRLGKRFGKRQPDEIDQVYERFAHHFGQKDEFVLPEEVLDDATFYEGGKQRITVNAYERNPKARKACIAHYGTRCQVCGFDFREQYGEIGQGIIHVHHLKPLSDIGKEYEIDPIQDLIPVCPNCHTIIHQRNPPYMVEEVQKFLRLASEASK
jgi:5-methylcytosine-specific restriction protein A